VEDRLSRYLRAEASRRFELGRADCVTFASNWVRLARGIDPIADCRGYAGDANACLRERGGRGGLLRAAGRALRRAGLRLTCNPRPGDVAVVTIASNLATCAIRTERGYVLRLDDGLASVPIERVRVLAAWQV
jgi:hypothetical protein